MRYSSEDMMLPFMLEASTTSGRTVNMVDIDSYPPSVQEKW